MQGEGLLRGLLGVCTVLGLAGRGSSAKHKVYWNSTNTRLYGVDYTVHVAINDYLDIYCPHYEPHKPVESFTLYMVNREGYEGCYLTHDASKRWECSSTQTHYGSIKFSEKIQRFTPFSLGFEFLPGKEYYYISIPDADTRGDCLRLRLSVCCPSTTVKPITEVPNSQPREGVPSGGGRGKKPGQGDPQRSLGRSSFSVHVSHLLVTLCLFFLVWN